MKESEVDAYRVQRLLKASSSIWFVVLLLSSVFRVLLEKKITVYPDIFKCSL